MLDVGRRWWISAGDRCFRHPRWTLTLRLSSSSKDETVESTRSVFVQSRLYRKRSKKDRRREDGSKKAWEENTYSKPYGYREGLNLELGQRRRKLEANSNEK